LAHTVEDNEEVVSSATESESVEEVVEENKVVIYSGHEEFAKRRDLREKYIVTIDGADSKDFDDAVSVEKMKNGKE